MPEIPANPALTKEKGGYIARSVTRPTILWSITDPAVLDADPDEWHILSEAEYEELFEDLADKVIEEVGGRLLAERLQERYGVSTLDELSDEAWFEFAAEMQLTDKSGVLISPLTHERR